MPTPLSLPKLDIGSGENPKEGFIHLDIYRNSPHLEVISNCYCLPFKDQSFVYVRASQVIEHISVDLARKMMLEMSRVLRLNGTLEICIPDIERFMGRWAMWTPEDKLNPLVQRIIMGEDTHPGMYHRAIHDVSTVEYLMNLNGIRLTKVDKHTRGPRDTIIYGRREE